MKKRMLIAITICLISVSPVIAGRYAGDFMAIGAGVRPLGMGGAFAAIADDGSAIYWNPSGIAQIKDSHIKIMHAFLYNGLASYNNISFCQPLPNDVTIGLNITRLTVEDIPYFDERYLIGTNVDQRINNSDLHLPGVPDGHFRSVDDLYQFAFARHIHYRANMGWMLFEVPFDFYFGGNVKFIRRQLKDNLGTGTGIDLGMLVRTELAPIFDLDYLGNLALGFNFQDVAGTDITWDTITEMREEILFNTKIGVAVTQPIPSLMSDVTLAFDHDYVYDTTSRWGLQWIYNDVGQLRVGYYSQNFTAGVSALVYGIGVDYAIITNPIGISNRVGIRINF